MFRKAPAAHLRAGALFFGPGFLALAGFRRLQLRPSRAREPVPAARQVSGRLAQLVEHLVYTERVGGSNPSPPTIFKTNILENSSAPARGAFTIVQSESLINRLYKGYIGE